MIYTKEYTLRTGDSDCYGNLQPAALLDMFQDIAGDHAEHLGCGYDDMAAQNLLWVIAKTRYEVLKTPHLHQKVKLTTWPLAPTRVSCRREYRLEDASGETVVIGTSVWVVIDAQTRKFTNVQDVYPKGAVFCKDTLFAANMSRVPLLVPHTSGHSVLPSFTDLDRNGHVNNTKYANYILNALNPTPDQVIRSFQIDYHREVLCNEPLSVHVQQENGKILALGQNKETEPMFAAEIVLQ